MSIWKRMKKAFNNYLLSLAEENKKTFGEGRLDCCNLNSNTENKDATEAKN